MILNSTDLAKSRPTLTTTKAYFDSLETAYSSTAYSRKDSTFLINNLTTEINKKLNFNDSLLHFRSNWTNDAVIDYSYVMFETLEHEPIYKYGDTVVLIFRLVNTLGLKSDTHEIIDFFPKDVGEQTGNSLTFKIPTKKLFKMILQPTQYIFEYNYVLRNSSTNKKDTLYHNKTITVIP